MAARLHRIGIAGCGKVAQLHARAIAEIEGACLAGVWSRTAENAQAFAQQHGARAYPTVGEMVASEKLDTVIVCSTHPTHRDSVVEAARAGAHALVEKPMASTLRDCDLMIDACASAGRNLGVVSQRRWYEPARRVKQAIEEGKLGQPILAVATLLGWRDQSYYDSDKWRGTWLGEGGGVLVNQAPHQLDLLLWFMGEIAEVNAYWDNLNHPGIEVEDTAVAVIRFANGALGNLLLSNSQKPGLYGSVQVHGANGASVGARTEQGAMFIAGKTGISQPPENDLWTVPGEEGLLDEWKAQDGAFFRSIDPTVYYLKRQIEDFIEAGDEGRRPAVTGKAGRKVVELFTAIYRSGRSGKAVKFPLRWQEGEADFDGRLPDESPDDA